MELEQSRYIEYEEFEEFIKWFGRLYPFIEEGLKKPMTAKQFQLFCRILYGCGLRISDGLLLRVKDIDFSNNILTVYNPKTKKSEKTTILPKDILKLKEHVKTLSKEDKLFKTPRSLFWKYVIDTSIISGLNLIEVKDTKTLSKISDNYFRKSCAKKMIKHGADRALIITKLRYRHRDEFDYFVPRNLEELSKWESKIYGMSK